jgi:hypothetical protein
MTVGEQPPSAGFGPGLRVAKIELSDKDVRRWNGAVEAARREGLVPSPNPSGPLAEGTAHARRLWEEIGDCLQPRAKNFVDIAPVPYSALDGIGAILLILTSMLHGALHLTAWGWLFPTRTEKLIWRLSCFSIAFNPLVLFFLSCGLHKRSNVLFAATVIIALVSAACSIFLFLESFLALRSSPSGVYARLGWLAFLPSLS